ncbi:MAG: transglycosylase SLT domain-containing protein [Burkholderiales bacterium]
MAKSDFDIQLDGTARASIRPRQIVNGIAVATGLIAVALFLSTQLTPGLAATWNQVADSIDQVRGAVAPAEAAAQEPADPKYVALGEYLAKRYRVSQDQTTDYVTTAYTVGREVGVDPLLILAVISVESRFNPIAESVMGAKGLMQIMPRFHPEKFEAFGGVKSVFEPEANITAGAKIIKEYTVRTRDVAEALQMYVGTSDDSDFSYPNKVMAELQRLKQITKPFDAAARTAQTESRSARTPG